MKLQISSVIHQDPVPGDNCRTLTKGTAMGEMWESGLEIGDEQDDDEQDDGDADLLTQAQRILLRLVVMQDDPAELRRVASRYLADSMSPAAVRALLGPEHVS
jgi:hypothetical protein